jgi:hypothetical protein
LERREVSVEGAGGPLLPIKEIITKNIHRNMGRDPGDELQVVHPLPLGHQEMEVRMKINPVAKGLDGGNDSGSRLAPGYKRKMDGPVWADDRSGQQVAALGLYRAGPHLFGHPSFHV